MMPRMAQAQFFKLGHLGSSCPKQLTIGGKYFIIEHMN